MAGSMVVWLIAFQFGGLSRFCAVLFALVSSAFPTKNPSLGPDGSDFREVQIKSRFAQLATGI